MKSGGYESGYQQCPCFWGDKPGSLVSRFATLMPLSGKRVLDAGCGEGKNAAFLAKQGCSVDAVDVSALAIANGKTHWPDVQSVNWIVKDVQAFLRDTTYQDVRYDAVIAYGIFHCLEDMATVREVIEELRRRTTPLGHHLVCAFNSRYQDLSAHPDLTPTLLTHDAYLALYANDELLFVSDENLTETHPHNGIRHTHSMTRLIAKIASHG